MAKKKEQDENHGSPMLEDDQIEKKLRASARMVVRTCMQMRSYENTLIITDPHTSQIGQAIYEQASLVSDRVLLLMMTPTHQHGDEPPGAVSELMRKQQLVIAPTKFSLTHTRATKVARNEGARIATLPGINLDIFTEGGMTADFAKMKDDITKVGALLKRRRNVKVTSEGGTDLEFEVEHRRWKLEDNGICNRPGQVTNLPAGKIFTMPKEGTMNGKMVIDGSWDSTLLEEPLILHIKDGMVVELEGNKISDEIKTTYERAASRLKPKEKEDVWTVAEFGFGMNPKARLMGNVLEDEKVKGTCYFAIGDNSTLGGSSHAKIHVTGVLKEPTVHLDEMVILQAGEITS
ncbi:MAG: leucyl aminopeptidase [Thermoplasmata archaeon]|nr:leucyl aminopeptidase [Thermoplasmata archaeon]|tara:strand:- start:368 stop:1411 length:1044 start_codon:yes stop_codon:yes gene_type:complete